MVNRVRNPELRSFARHRTWSTLSEQPTSNNAGRIQASQSEFKRLPRRDKKRMKKESHAGSPSSPSLTIVKVRAGRRFTPTPSVPKRTIRAPRHKLLASIANKLRTHDEVAYERLKDPGSNPKILAAEILSGSFMPVLAKYRWHNPLHLMELAIIYVRTEGSKDTTDEPAVEVVDVKPAKPKLTARQLEQVAQTPPPPPMTDHVSVTSRKARKGRKGAPKTVPTREKVEDSQIVQVALDAFLRDDPVLKASLCDASIIQAKRLLRANSRIGHLVGALSSELASPTRVYTYLDSAIKVLIPEYREVQRREELAAKAAAEDRRRERVAGAAAKAQRDQQRVHRKTSVLTPAQWAALNRT